MVQIVAESLLSSALLHEQVILRSGSFNEQAYSESDCWLQMEFIDKFDKQKFLLTSKNSYFTDPVTVLSLEIFISWVGPRK